MRATNGYASRARDPHRIILLKLFTFFLPRRLSSKRETVCSLVDSQLISKCRILGEIQSKSVPDFMKINLANSVMIFKVAVYPNFV